MDQRNALFTKTDIFLFHIVPFNMIKGFTNVKQISKMNIFGEYHSINLKLYFIKEGRNVKIFFKHIQGINNAYLRAGICSYMIDL